MRSGRVNNEKYPAYAAKNSRIVTPTSFLEVLPDEVFIADGDGYALWVNTAGLKYYGVDRQALVGRHVSDLETSGFFQPSAVVRVLEQGEPVTILQKTRMGNHLLVTANPIVGNSDKIEHVVCASKDITDISLLRREVETFRNDANDSHAQAGEHVPPKIVASSPAMRHIVHTCIRVAPSDCTVLFTGESGVGKDLLASFIHSMSPRSEGPFIRVNCGAIPETLFESEVFGYEPGAFTGALKSGRIGLMEAAHNGTVFLDEVAEISLPNQVKLLQALQYCEVRKVGSNKSRQLDVRVLAATNQDIEELVRSGAFRRDLYYRLNVIRIVVPPLRMRPEDIIELTRLFLHRFTSKHNRQPKKISASALEKMAQIPWPGNARELQNLIERLVIMVDGDTIKEDDIATALETSLENSLPPLTVHKIVPLKTAQWEMERQLLEICRASCQSTYEMARLLKVNQSTVVRKLKNTLAPPD